MLRLIATPFAAASACPEVFASDPSIRTKTFAACPAARRSAYSGGISIPTEARPATIDSCSSRLDVTYVDTLKVRVLSKSRISCRLSWVRL